MKTQYLNKGRFSVMKNNFPGSNKYWTQRYAEGGNSGAGSYGKFARFKAEVINKFVSEREIKSVIEFGCGDGNQLKLANYSRFSPFLKFSADLLIDINQLLVQFMNIVILLDKFSPSAPHFSPKFRMLDKIN